jgi:hypothetical protein
MKKMEGTTDGHFFERLFVNEIRKTVLVGPFWKNKKRCFALRAKLIQENIKNY